MTVSANAGWAQAPAESQQHMIAIHAYKFPGIVIRISSEEGLIHRLQQTRNKPKSLLDAAFGTFLPQTPRQMAFFIFASGRNSVFASNSL